MTPDQFIERFSPQHFFHFTDTRNLPSISEHGLLSLAEIRRLAIDVPVFGGNDWSHEADESRGLDRYVHLCLLGEHPMEYVARVKDERILQSRFIPVSTDVLSIEGARFTAEVANRSGSKLLTLEEACETMDFEVIYDRTDWGDPKIQERRQLAKKYELLIPGSIPIEYLSI